MLTISKYRQSPLESSGLQWTLVDWTGLHWTPLNFGRYLAGKVHWSPLESTGVHMELGGDRQDLFSSNTLVLNLGHTCSKTNMGSVVQAGTLDVVGSCRLGWRIMGLLWVLAQARPAYLENLGNRASNAGWLRWSIGRGKKLAISS